MTSRRRSNKSVSQSQGWRSGLEEAIGDQLVVAGVKADFESIRIPYTQPVKVRHYTPDFTLPNGIVIETKGRFETPDRQKHLLVKEQWPDLDIRFVFSRANQRISKISKTTYGMWATTNGFQWSERSIPPSWLREAHNDKSQKMIEQFLKKG